MILTLTSKYVMCGRKSEVSTGKSCYPLTSQLVSAYHYLIWNAVTFGAAKLQVFVKERGDRGGRGSDLNIHLTLCALCGAKVNILTSLRMCRCEECGVLVVKSGKGLRNQDILF